MKDDPIGLTPRASVLAGALCLGAALAHPRTSGETIRLVAGSPRRITDYLARMSAKPQRPAGAQVVVENKAGATGNLAIEHVAEIGARRYTLLLVRRRKRRHHAISLRLAASILSTTSFRFSTSRSPQLLSCGPAPGEGPAAISSAHQGESGNHELRVAGREQHASGRDHFARLAGLQMVHVPTKHGPALAYLVADACRCLGGLGRCRRT